LHEISAPQIFLFIGGFNFCWQLTGGPELVASALAAMDTLQKKLFQNPFKNCRLSLIGLGKVKRHKQIRPVTFVK
jgi:hypothetical protein